MGLSEAVQYVKTWKQVLVILFLIFAVWFIPKGLDYVNNNDEREFKKWEKIFNEQTKQKEKEKDSIIAMQIKQAEQAVINNSRIYKELNELAFNLEEEAHVSILKVHDHGGIPNTGEPLRITMLYTVKDITLDIQEEWQAAPLLNGYSFWLSSVIERGSRYTSDIKKEREVYTGKTKETIDKRETVSMYTIHLGSGTDATYFLTASFKKRLTLEQQARTILVMNYSSKLLNQLIYYKYTKSN